MAAPPSPVGAVQFKVTEPSPPIPVRPVGIPGTLATITLELLAEKAPVPRALTAATRKMYVVPLESPVTLAKLATLTPSLNRVHVPPLLDEYSMTKSVSVFPPLLAGSFQEVVGAAHETSTRPAVPENMALEITGALGVRAGVFAEELETFPVPIALIAEMRM